jgi:DNA-binding XRE family transcriptional regulator
MACCRTRLAGYNPEAVCRPCQQALSDQQRVADPGARDEMATWAWETETMRRALARLDFRAVLVIYRSAARLSRRQLAERAGLAQSTIWYWEAGERHGLYDIRQLLQFADSMGAPRPALVPVILGPQAPGDPTTGTAPLAEGTGRG